MSSSLLQTKLYIPLTRSDLVPRPRLIEQMNEGLRQSQGFAPNLRFGRKLTLISAPAGFGKTTLVSNWLQQIDLPMAWLSLDEGDNDLARFLTYLIAALQQIDLEIGQTVPDLLQSRQSPHPEALMTMIINNIVLVPTPFILVLDDYHCIDDQSIHAAIDLLLDHLPQSVHLVITSRADAPLSLSRLRGRGQLTELRATDLRFTLDEASVFLSQVMGLDLSADDVAVLEARTEGWIAGLQLAALALQTALSIQPQPDLASFIAAFKGDDRYILDYLADEVLARRPKGTKTFLMQTSILNRLCGSLCDAITGQDKGQITLEQIEAANLFIVPLDNKRQWYRYHHLFADLLRQRLRQENPDQVLDLHRRASHWFEQAGLIDEAIEHALAAEDFEQVASLIEQHVAKILWQSRDIRTSWSWLEALPKQLVSSRPQLCLIKAWSLFLLFTGQEETIEALLQAAEQAIYDRRFTRDGVQLDNATENVVENRQTSLENEVLGGIDHLRANLARLQDHIPLAIELSQRALERLPEDDIFQQIGAKINLASAYDSLGQVTKANPIYRESIALSRKADFTYATILASANLIEVLTLQGQLRRANSIFQQIQPTLEQRPGPAAGMVYVSMGEVLAERNELETAVTYIRKGIELCQPFEAWETTLLKGKISLARVLQARGDIDQARKLLQEVEQLDADEHPSEPTPRRKAFQARLWLAQGDRSSAMRWADEAGLRVEDRLSYQYEIDYLTLARILINQALPHSLISLEVGLVQKGWERSKTDVLQQALTLLTRLLNAVEATGRQGRVIEVLALQALAWQAQGQVSQALEPLKRALALAEPEGYVRLFVDEGPAMAGLLYEAAARGIAPTYAGQLLAAFPEAKPGPSDVRDSKSTAVSMVEPLTQRELEVLRLIAEGHSNREIAQKLFLSLGTVKVHSRNIYGKLGIKSRTQAVAKANTLGIL